jgi:integrase/recombinase XerD
MGRKVKVILQPVKFRKRLHVAILCLNFPEVDAVIREFDEAEWSTGYRFWHVPLKLNTIKKLSNSLKKIAVVDSSAFVNIHISKEDAEEQKIKKRSKAKKPSKDQIEKILFIQKLFLDKGYSFGTAKVYCSLLKVFFEWFKDKDEKDLTKEDINSFLNEYIVMHSLTNNYRRLMLNAITRYFRFIGRIDLSGE